MVMGRPTKYLAEHCDTLIALMKKGGSKAEVCAKLEITPQTFLNWQDSHTDFFEAVKFGSFLSKSWWEKKGREGVFGGTKGFSATGYSFQMKNRFGKEDEFGEKWSDKQEQIHSGLIEFHELSEEEIDRRLIELVSKSED